ncbi:MAG: hypothetical protein ACRDN9_05940 [Streptosporangiaceae bacterium]
MRAATRPWTSTLASPELAAIRSVGFEPVGQVLGASVHTQVGPYRAAQVGIPGAS